jgi:ubiquinone/menaquinone biosynthesis C-methylase UbiE
MKPGWIARQSRRPSGWVGEVVARVMARETRAANAFALERLRLAPGDAVLEIGCGHGETLARLAERVAGGFAAGIDPSDVMVRLASRRLRRAIARGHAAVHRAEASHLPFPDARFDAALAVHVLPFWADPARELREIRRVLRPGAPLVLGFRPDGPEARASLPGSVYHLRPASEVAALLREAGFEVCEASEPRIQGMLFACLEARAAALGGRHATPARDGSRG